MSSLRVSQQICEDNYFERALHSLARVNQLLGDIVEEVPATEGKRTLEESQG